jgi:hypothetical protein
MVCPIQRGQFVSSNVGAKLKAKIPMPFKQLFKHWLCDARKRSRVWLFIGLALAAFQAKMPAQTGPPKPLAIVGGGIESSEDAPNVSADYEFMPGDFLYFQFEIAGFKVAGNDDSGGRRISIAYSVEAADQKGVLLAPAAKGQIEDEITRQDKDWVPRRRASFLLPSYVAHGTYHVKLSVQDLFGKSEIERDFAFLIGGRKIEPNPSLGIQNLRFLRSDQDGPGLEIAAYRPADTIWARFDMTGFTVGPGNTVRLEYDISVLRPDGKVIFDQKSAATKELEALFYPPQFVPGELSVTTTKDLHHGEYTLVVQLHDLIGKKTAGVHQQFRIE